ncbi:class II aldolase/adducin family protein [Halopseudomonas phragmitis]|uniref:Class II aldolase/adducin family protein n=1 Tax=Halopseudomonas phragmitis TaxID=1931241 RepID=A0A1V0B968_9GAMM|nr:class II aldolase/adducin family protein [Halopseudomonas phragmitis]AQZ96324.1 class II aldolase/adducin family protein [Halopseudomonas phragmitis]
MNSSMIEQVKMSTVGGERAAKIPLPPSFTDPCQHRAYLKQRLAAAFRLFALYQFDEGLAGHITVRDPVEPDTFWVNPVGVHFALIRASDLVRLDHSGKLVEGEALVNLAAFMIHSRIHARYPQINAVAHAHSPKGRAWSAFGKPLQPLTQDGCVFFERHAVFSQFNGVVHQQGEGDAIADQLAEGHVGLILQNHGLLTVGKDVDSAVSLFIQLEKACETQLLVQAAGADAQPIPAEIARKTRAFTGSDLVVWGNFQPQYEMIARLQPDLLD